MNTYYFILMYSVRPSFRSFSSKTGLCAVLISGRSRNFGRGSINVSYKPVPTSATPPLSLTPPSITLPTGGAGGCGAEATPFSVQHLHQASLINDINDAKEGLTDNSGLQTGRRGENMTPPDACACSMSRAQSVTGEGSSASMAPRRGPTRFREHQGPVR